MQSFPLARIALAVGACALMSACGGGGGGGAVFPILPPAPAPAPPAPPPPPAPAPVPAALVIGHRGEPAKRPEHTLASYQQAIDDGADFIEPDLVPTKDGELVARHENAIAIVDANGNVLEATTNVVDVPKFASRKTTKTIDGRAVTGWFTEDFTLAELKELRARERIPAQRPANVSFNDQFQVPTLDEVIELAKAQSQAKGRTIGIYPETKHPTYFRSIGLPLENRLLDTLQKHGLNKADAPVFVQSFETGNLKDVRLRSTVRIVQLIGGSGAPYDLVALGDKRTYADLVKPEGLAEIATYAQGIGPDKSRVIPVVAGKLGTPTTLVKDAHDKKLFVHIYTVRPENAFLPDSLKKEPKADGTVHGDTAAEIKAFLDAGIDGLFADSAATAVPVVKAYSAQKR
ncbi:glycerophosphodiester phosphodiesterase [Variovorax sp.]|jgi:glycerophosphoryl diester phosphodiesterase|uniref:glycerophosphodiester phosphodiesterase n=1 Tax=Variovorax sp. TaxID=1871043 RepID=UPI000C4AF8AA|nr:glycerophosphodiester phosphodiesterase [Variovorax sp.]MBS81200.1 glycerophosphodiester phosphodiesterase [Variovorax sp.]